MINEKVRIEKILISDSGKRAFLIGYDEKRRRHEMYCPAKRGFALLTIDRLIEIRLAVSIDPEPLTQQQKRNLMGLIREKTIRDWIEQLETAQVRLNYHITDSNYIIFFRTS